MDSKSAISLVAIILLSAGCIDNLGSDNPANSAEKSSLQSCIDACSTENSPVCSTNNTNYKNNCILSCNGAILSHIGECASEIATTAKKWCNDSDNGSNLFVKGTTTSSGGNGIDFCVNSSAVEEYSCQIEVTRQANDCPSGYECSDGACAQTRPIGCVDSDNGTNLDVNGTVTLNGNDYADTCSSMFIVKEYFCSKGTVDNMVMQCPEGQRCGFGKCVPIIYTCNDSDSGIKIYDRGTVTIFSDAGHLNSFADSCQDDNSVKEYFCSNNLQNSTIRDCPSDHYCDRGACKEADCIDSDGGTDIYTSGYASKGNLTYDDRCTSSGVVREYFCDGKDVEYDSIACPSDECDNGACVRVP